MDEYGRVVKGCSERGELWEDPDFPASQTSVFYHQTPPFTFQWRRPKELSSNPVFIREECSQFDIVHGKLGDRWFVSCLGCLHLTKGLFYRVVPADQDFEQDAGYCGVFRFRVWWCGEWKEVLVDDRLPTVNGKLVFVHSQSTNQFWPSLLEKAYAKLHGSYEALKYGTSLDGLSDFTGGIAESISLRADPTTCGRLLSKLLELTSIVTAVVNQHSHNKVHSEKLASGIVMGINYRIYAVEKVDRYNGEQVCLVRMRTPVGTSAEYLGAWGRSTPEWDEVPPNEKERLNLKYTPDGEFWMAYSDFVRTFSQLEVIHLDGETSRDEPSLKHKMPWTSRVYQGSWQKGVTAGGCRNNPDTFHINPQLHLILSDMEEVVISLNQHSVMEPKVIGFTAYALSKNGLDSISKAFFKKNKSLVNSQYTNSRQVSERVQLEQGGYILLPTTFEPGQESSFTLRVFSSKPLKLKLVDTSPSLVKSALLKAHGSMDGKSLQQYEAVFLQVADEHRSVNAFELHELLEACLPNDYIKSCASLDICRQVILALDSSSTGRLRFSDFKDLMVSLKFWQNAFKSHTKERTGILKAERLRDALEDVGFQLSTEVVSTLVLRYMRKDGTLRFGDFVSAILHLSVAFSIFEKRDPLQNGAIKFSLAEWLKSTLMC
ncbi:calpain-C [Macrobrachium rosenbergii]|uniref:calpain-C n=1 Tax=Macrobrachium rosenbergii TaxID=79674 RepID=UPI0034D6F724